MNKDRAQARNELIEELIEEQMDALGHLLSPQDRHLARSMLADILATHPTTADLLDQIVVAPVVDRSDKIAKETGVAADADADADTDGEEAGGASS